MAALLATMIQKINQVVSAVEEALAVNDEKEVSAEKNVKVDSEAVVVVVAVVSAPVITKTARNVKVDFNAEKEVSVVNAVKVVVDSEARNVKAALEVVVAVSDHVLTKMAK